MDRVIVSPFEQAQDTDILKTNRNAMLALAKLSSMVLGTNTLLNGLACAPTSPVSLNVEVGAGEIYSLQAIDSTTYSSLPTDSHQVLKQGVRLDKITLACPAPSTTGFSVRHLVQISFAEVDTDGASRQFKDPDTGAITTLTKNQTRQGQCVIELKQGVAALDGTETTPTPDPGKIGAYIVTVKNGYTAVNVSDIAIYPNAPFVTERLTDKISKITADGYYLPKIVLIGTARMSNAQVLPHGNVPTKVNYDTFEDGDASLWDSDKKAFVPTRLGWYSMKAVLPSDQITTPGEPGKDFVMDLYRNGVQVKRLAEVSFNSGDITLPGSFDFKVTTLGDFFEIYASNSSDLADITIGSATSALTYFQIRYLGT